MVQYLQVAALLLGMVSAANYRGSKAAPEKAVALSGSLVKPLKFNQPLLLCNAYPSKSVAQVSANGKPLLDSLAFQQCRYTDTNVLAKDKIDFMLTDAGIEGTFEVGDLPQTDSVLLLVLQKRDDHSPLMAFQSFAFPSNSASAEAHVAVIDASANSHKAHLQIADKPAQGDVRRVEELSFNRVYALEQGSYDISVLDQGVDTPKQMVQLLGQRDYVLMRTGGEELGAKSLVAFPHDELHNSGSVRSSALAALLVAVVTMMVSA